MLNQTRSTVLGLAFAALPFAAGCGMPDGQPVGGSDEFRQAIPQSSQIALNVPGTQAIRQGEAPEDHVSLAEAGQAISLRGLAQTMNALAIAQKRATFYQATYDVSRALNGFTIALVALIKEVDRHPATTEDANRRTWGPWTEALSPTTLKFVIERTGPASLTFALVGKPKGASDAAYVQILGGSFFAVGSGHGHGNIFIDATAAAATDPHGKGGSGRLDINWDAGTSPRTVDIALADFTDRRGDDTVSARYHYAEAADSSGVFEFLVHGDLDKDSDPQNLKPNKERLGIVSRWLGTGAGRSDVVITGVDLPWPEVHAMECWDEGFWRTYYIDDRSLAPTEGDAGSCVLPPL